MPKLDKLKEKLGILKFWLGITVATFLALVGWIVTNYKQTEPIILIGAIICAFFTLITIFILNKKINILLDEIERS